jgi:enoyl-CoA hydratase
MNALRQQSNLRRISTTLWLLPIALVAPEGLHGQSLEQAAAAYERLVVERQGPIVIGRFSNPQRNEMMDGVTVRNLSDLLDHVEADSTIRVLVLTGNSEDVFIRSYDLATASSAGSLPPGALHAMNEALLKMQSIGKPIIAAINGQAGGGGFETALAADFRFMWRDGFVHLPEVRAGIIPGAGGTQRLPRLIVPGKALEMIMLSTRVDGETAERLGIVTRAVERDRLMEEALDFANRLVQMPAHSLAAAKRAYWAGMELPLREALLIEQESFYGTMLRRQPVQR